LYLACLGLPLSAACPPSVEIPQLAVLLLPMAGEIWQPAQILSSALDLIPRGGLGRSLRWTASRRTARPMHQDSCGWWMVTLHQGLVEHDGVHIATIGEMGGLGNATDFLKIEGLPNLEGGHVGFKDQVVHNGAIA
jgi:hypothetical protein